MAVLRSHQPKTLAHMLLRVGCVCVCVRVTYVCTRRRCACACFAYLETFVGCVREDASG